MIFRSIIENAGNSPAFFRRWIARVRYANRRRSRSR